MIVACSGGPDSLALAGAVAWCAPRAGRVVHAVIVDHGLQVDSANVAEAAAQACRALGIANARIVRVQVPTGAGGPEANARTARYAALDAAAADLGAAAVLLAHTREDQAETVLLGLARGSGARSLSGMRERNGRWVRPLLQLPRATVHEAAAELLAPTGLAPWRDPHNDDPAYARVRVRHWLDTLGDDLGPGVVAGLARSADLLRDDADALDALAEQAHMQVRADGAGGREELDIAALTDLPRAVRTRVLRAWCIALGCPADALTRDHVLSVEALVTDWHGQGEVSLPGGVGVVRAYGRLTPT